MLSGTLNSLGSILLLSDVEPFRYEDRIGFETLVVHTVNQWALHFSLIEASVYVNA